MTVLVAGYLAHATSHFVGGNLSDAEGLAFFKWARDGGDLRVPHFFAIHAMHFIPAFGFIVSRMFSSPAGHKAVLAFCVLYVAFVACTFVEALMGKPFLAMLG